MHSDPKQPKKNQRPKFEDRFQSNAITNLQKTNLHKHSHNWSYRDLHTALQTEAETAAARTRKPNTTDLNNPKPLPSKASPLASVEDHT
jgi:hypothetical protein